MAHDRAMAEAQRELAGMRGEVTPYGPHLHRGGAFV
jgi:hypothetical protein